MLWIINTIAHMVARLPERVVVRGARALTILSYDILRLRRSTILKNLHIAYGLERSSKELVEIGRESVFHFVLSFMEFLRSVKIDISAHTTIQDQHYLDEALKQDRGAFILCLHLGNWEAMGSVFTRHIRPAHVIVKKVGKGAFGRFVDEQRAKNDFLAIGRNARGDGFRAIRRILEDKEIVGFVIDQARPGEPKLPFFGQDAKTNTSFASLWRRYRAPIVPAFMRRESLGHHVLTFLPPLELERTKDRESDVLAHSVAFNQVAERMINLCPHQYFWLHDRWKA